jgi:hypothetical protein
MYAYSPINQLGDVHVHGNTNKSVGIVTAQVFLSYQEIDHVAYCHLSRGFLILVETHGYVGGGRLRARP